MALVFWDEVIPISRVTARSKIFQLSIRPLASHSSTETNNVVGRNMKLILKLPIYERAV
jgi:hypothetical protein